MRLRARLIRVARLNRSHQQVACEGQLIRGERRRGTKARCADTFMTGKCAREHRRWLSRAAPASCTHVASCTSIRDAFSAVIDTAQVQRRRIRFARPSIATFDTPRVFRSADASRRRSENDAAEAARTTSRLQDAITTARHFRRRFYYLPSIRREMK